jgi:hypothetical protein
MKARVRSIDLNLIIILRKSCYRQGEIFAKYCVFTLRCSNHLFSVILSKLCASEKGASHASFYIAISYNIRSAYLVLLRNEDREFFM